MQCFSGVVGSLQVSALDAATKGNRYINSCLRLNEEMKSMEGLALDMYPSNSALKFAFLMSGLNCAEAVNFASADWLNHMEELYRLYHRPAVLSNEKLLCAVAMFQVLEGKHRIILRTDWQIWEQVVFFQQISPKQEEEEEDNSKVMKQHTLEHVREGFCRHWEPRYGPRTGDSRAMTAYLPGKKEETHVIFFHLG
ncbi:hypothetical protein HPP92_001497 [Vanilla planifolia]|uniref:Uncharacterized protein n=1 Tax=Vanilla planifolia TaxID=51239 RepID=A0A835RR72_VANPL|nr:hypothetical protein HPP92_001497 [Vanilla planifolia]